MNPGVIIPRPVCKTSATDGHLYHASSAARSRKTSPLPSSASLALIIIPCSLDCTYFQDRSVLYTDSQSDKPVQFGLWTVLCQECRAPQVLIFYDFLVPSSNSTFNKAMEFMAIHGHGPFSSMIFPRIQCGHWISILEEPPQLPLGNGYLSQNGGHTRVAKRLGAPSIWGHSIRMHAPQRNGAPRWRFQVIGVPGVPQYIAGWFHGKSIYTF